MIRRSPAENYYKYLITHPDLYDNAYIQQVATALSLDYLGDWYLQWLRDHVVPPTPFYPEDLRHKPSQRFLLKEMLSKVFNPCDDMRAAMRILQRPRAREVVETMVLSGAPDEPIALALDVRLKFRTTAFSVQLFRHYFWDITLLDSTEMRALLDLRYHRLMGDKDPAIQAQYAALQRARYRDPRVVAARLPSTPLSSLLAQVEAGVMPKTVDLAKIVDATRTLAALRAWDSTMQGGPTGAQMAIGYSTVADIMNRIHETVVKPEEQLRADLQKIALATSPTKIPTIQQLTDGKHTTNIHPEPKSEVIEVDSEGVGDDFGEENVIP